MDSSEQFVFAFNAKIKFKSFEQFSLLLCDLEKCESIQKELLYNILLKDHTSPTYWFDYVNYATTTFNGRKMQLQRLVNKAIECIDEEKHRMNKSYLLLHLSSASLKNNDVDAMKYFESVIWKKKIGICFSILYLSWAQIARKINKEKLVESIDILKKGMENQAEPQHSIITMIQEYENLATDESKKVVESKISDTDDATCETTHSELYEDCFQSPIDSHFESESDNVFNVHTKNVKVLNTLDTIREDSASTDDADSSVSEMLTDIAETTEKISIPSVNKSAQKRIRLSTKGSSGNSYNARDHVFICDDNDEKPKQLRRSSNARQKQLNDTATDKSIDDDESINHTRSTRRKSSVKSNNNVDLDKTMPLDDVESTNHTRSTRRKSSVKSNSNVDLDKTMPLDDVESTNHTRSTRRKSSVKSSNNVDLDKTMPLDDVEFTNHTRSTRRKSSVKSNNNVDLDKTMPLDDVESMNYTRSTRRKSSVKSNSNVDLDKTMPLDDVESTNDTRSTRRKSSVKSNSNVDLDKTMPLDDVESTNHTRSTRRKSSVKSNSNVDLDKTMPLDDVESTNHTRSTRRKSSVKSNSNVDLDKTMPLDEIDISNKNDLNRRGSHGSTLSEDSNRTEQLISATNENNIEKNKKKSDSLHLSNIVQSSSSSKNEKKKPVSEATATHLQECIELITICGKDYVKLGLLGKGGSSIVYRVLSPLTGALYAFKKIEVKDDDDDQWNGYLNEIDLLKSLRGSNHIIELIDAEVNPTTRCISMLMELGDIDLAKVLSQRTKANNIDKNSAHVMNPFFARMVWSEMLEAVDYIHKNRIVHGDLKPANFVFVKGQLKLIDFGIARSFSNDTTNIYRDNQIGTINFMAPEAIAPFSFPQNPENEKYVNQNSKIRLGTASDIWSLGCILYQIVYGRPPFADLNTIQKLQAIPNAGYVINYPQHMDKDAIETIKCCLHRDPKSRSAIRGIDGLLQHKYLALPSFSSSTSASIINTTSSSNESTLSKNIKSNTAVNSTIDDKENILISTEELNRNETTSKKLLQPPSVSGSSIKNPNMKSISSNLKQQILSVTNNKMFNDITNSRETRSSSNRSESRGDKWMKPKGESPEKFDMRSVLEKRIGAIRKFLEVEPDDHGTSPTRTEFFTETGCL